MTEPRIERAFVEAAHGLIHYAATGEVAAPALLLLHQTPRSWREYEAVLPLLGTEFRAIAMDTAGFGDSSALDVTPSIERWAAVAVELLDRLEIDQCHVVGHHTGGVIGVELASAFPARVRSLVLSSTPYTDENFRRARIGGPPVDEVELASDGSHLTELWQRRQRYYPEGRPELLTAFVSDALRVAGDLESGHRVVSSYRMEDRVDLLVCPTLLIRAPDDPFASSHAAGFSAVLPHAQVVDIPGGMVPLPDQLPEAFADVVRTFVLAQGRGRLGRR